MRGLVRLLRDTAGAVVIETAIVAPALVLMSVGTLQVSQVVARQHELQAGADEAMGIALAGWTDNDTQVAAMKTVLKRSTNVTDANITITRMYRCGTDTSYVTDKTTCGTNKLIATFLRMKLKDTYTPVWTQLGVGQPINLAVTRMVQVS
ncbi:TadE/TadG family type IV pilus assembly protein [Novosphingobium sp.]|uniref:TadE/TadG family type IV pilus assembly protein n=1 Tax=Novosphingobium sp. TaxID=1874826 RepID=UPI0025DD53C7|nr:TadE/TadG family type IV pilus assembly protein [Novosphingobium sp.]